MSAEIFLITHPRVVFFFFCSYQSIKSHVNTLLSTQKIFCFLLNLRFRYQKSPDSHSSWEGANKQVISSQADSLIKISRIWADF
ncbi:hypothetical protein, partial [Escherichia coli]